MASHNSSLIILRLRYNTLPETAITVELNTAKGKIMETEVTLATLMTTLLTLFTNALSTATLPKKT